MEAVFVLKGAPISTSYHFTCLSYFSSSSSTMSFLASLASHTDDDEVLATEETDDIVHDYSKDPRLFALMEKAMNRLMKQDQAKAQAPQTANSATPSPSNRNKKQPDPQQQGTGRHNKQQTSALTASSNTPQMKETNAIPRHLQAAAALSPTTSLESDSLSSFSSASDNQIILLLQKVLNNQEQMSTKILSLERQMHDREETTSSSKKNKGKRAVSFIFFLGERRN